MNRSLSRAHASRSTVTVDLRRDEAQVEDAVAVDVAPNREAHDCARRRPPSRCWPRNRRHELLEDARHGEQRQRPRNVLLRAQHGLPVAVVAQRAGLAARPGGRSRATAARSDASSSTAAKRGVRSPCVAGVGLLAQAVLRVVERAVALRDVVFARTAG